MSKNKSVVYTCITNGYDTLHEIRYLSPSIDYVCFTDDASLSSKTWKIRPLPEEVLSETSPIKRQRLVKLLPHKWFPDYETSLWIDSNIEVIGDVSDFFAKYDLDKTDKLLYVNKHPSRDCIYREHLAVVRLKKDTFDNTSPQIERYRNEGFPKHFGLAETNILLRKHNNQHCIKLMETWAEEIRSGSHRDQLSFDYCVWKCDCKSKIAYLDEKYYNLHVGDNAFFCLKKHIRVKGFKPQTIELETEKKSSQTEEKKEKKPVSVVVFTHERTNVAKETLKSLFRNLSYSGEINWIVSDDRSSEKHLAELDSVFKDNGIKYELCKTSSERFGLGASMNNGLKKAFEKSDIVLRTEDDWVLERKLDLDRFVDVVEKNDNVAGIRLGMIGSGLIADEGLFFDKTLKALVGTMGEEKSLLFVNQVALIHRRLHDDLGWYDENTTADKAEIDFVIRFNKATNCGKKRWLFLGSTEMKWRTFDDPSLWFIHVGRSTLGHLIYREPKRYGWLYNNASKTEQKEETPLIKEKNIDLIVSMTTYKPRLIQKNLISVIQAILDQKTKLRFKIVVTIYKDDEKYIWPELSTFMQKNEIELIVAEKNLRPHLKYFYAMQRYRDVPIVTIDDDCIYSSDLLESLYSSYIKHPNCVSARRVHCIRYFQDGHAMKYNDWLYEYKGELNPSQDLFATGVGGVLYPPDLLKISDGDASYILENCLTNDDLFLKKRENDFDVKTVYVKSNKRSYVSLNASIEKHALSVSDNRTNNDKIIDKIGISKKKILTKRVDLCYILDEKYVIPVMTSINSLRRNRNLNVVYRIFLICENVSIRSLQAIKELEDRNFSIVFVSNPGNIAKYDFKQVNNIPKTACYKFFLDKLLSNIDKVLYVDGDTIILKDLYDVYSINVDDKYCAAVKDFKVCKKYLWSFFKSLVKKNNGYFNSGVMLLNLKKLREDNIAKKLISYRLNGVNYFADQDALNVCFEGKVKYLSPSCNFIASNLLFSSDEIKRFYGEDDLPRTFSEVESNKKTTIYHITGIDKPWKTKTSNAYRTFSKYMV